MVITSPFRCTLQETALENNDRLALRLPLLVPQGPLGAAQASGVRGIMDFTISSGPRERASADDLCILRFHQYCIRRAPPAAGLQLTACPSHMRWEA